MNLKGLEMFKKILITICFSSIFSFSMSYASDKIVWGSHVTVTNVNCEKMRVATGPVNQNFPEMCNTRLTSGSRTLKATQSATFQLQTDCLAKYTFGVFPIPFSEGDCAFDGGTKDSKVIHNAYFKLDPANVCGCYLSP